MATRELRRFGRLGLLLVLPAIGCIPAVQNRAAPQAIAPPGLVALPPQVLVYTVDWLGRRDAVESLTNYVVLGLERRLPAIVAANGGHIASTEQLKRCGSPCVEFFLWGGRAALQIGLQREKLRDYGRHSVTDWGFWQDLSPVRASLKADFALFLVFTQARGTSGRKAMEVLLSSYIPGKQLDVACIADLHDGKMTWCTSRGDDSHDLADPDRLAPILRALLQDVLRIPTQIYDGPPVPQGPSPGPKGPSSPWDGP